MSVIKLDDVEIHSSLRFNSGPTNARPVTRATTRRIVGYTVLGVQSIGESQYAWCLLEHLGDRGREEIFTITTVELALQRIDDFFTKVR
jgi:hypothetical protein